MFLESYVCSFIYSDKEYAILQHEIDEHDFDKLSGFLRFYCKNYIIANIAV